MVCGKEYRKIDLFCHISVLLWQNLILELCRNVKSYMLELRYEVLSQKHRYCIN
jgi:hypothetical protein